MKRIAFVLIAIVIYTACNQPKIDNPDITRDELYESIAFLASDSLKGRKPGTPEGKIAAKYIGDKLLQMGYEPLGENIFQYFEVVTNVSAGKNNLLEIENYAAALNEDFVPFNFSANTEAEGKIAFCGFGFDIDTENITWSDFAEIKLEGKWALMLRADPELDNPDSEFIPYSREESKVLNARDHGAIGVLFVSGVNYDKRDQLVDLALDQSMSDFGIPVFHIKRTLANKILEQTNQSIESLEEKLIHEMHPFSFEIDKQAKAVSDVVYEKVNTQNVIAWMPGSDPEYKEEYILFGAHYDHLGMGGPNSGSRTTTEVGIHYGADDNASGVGALIEIAEKLASNKAVLKRNVIIMAFGAEETGLLGSKYFAANPLVELSQIKEMVNIDMVGRLKSNKELLVGGTGTSVEGEGILDSIGQFYDLNFSFSPNGFGPSDHAVFYAENIPVFFFSTGPHADYHTPRDVVDSINFDGLVTLANFVYELGFDLINRNQNLTYQEAGPKGKTTHQGRRSKVKLGIMPNFGESDNKGLRVDAVTPDGPAYLGGMKKGDVIVAIEGKEIHNIYEYMERMSKLHFGQTVNVDVMRDGEKKVLLVQLEEME